MSNQHLFAVLLGGKNLENSLMEDHHLVFVVAENEDQARILAKNKWKVFEIHVDGTQLIKSVDGYNIKLEKSENMDDEFSINPNYSY